MSALSHLLHLAARARARTWAPSAAVRHRYRHRQVVVFMDDAAQMLADKRGRTLATFVIRKLGARARAWAQIASTSTEMGAMLGERRFVCLRRVRDALATAAVVATAAAAAATVATAVAAAVAASTYYRCCRVAGAYTIALAAARAQKP